ncbi:MAG TPA: acyltransferase family protein, partial [Candidatus Limnocylindria bacterium]|nr:acyltransferase family protein [Candidatus Limnocylindria bacterium]
MSANSWTGVLSGGKSVREATHAVPDRIARVAHIDGLRAVAVFAVVGYHAGVPGFGGGFVGVDVFFVISGYLIINHLVGEMSSGTFSLVQFYARRSLRLFPPLIVVILASTAAAAFILVSPYEWEWFGLSAFFSSIYLSNFYFLSKQGYFDVDAYQKPLLHTWSLSVEEQFYFVVPLLLMGCFAIAARSKISAYRILAFVCAAVFGVSLLGSILATDPVGRNHAFYMMHWRAWEFAAGGAIGFLARSAFLADRKHIADAAGIAGIAIIVATVLLIDDRSHFPGFLAVLPVAGAVLVLASGLVNPNAATTRLIAWKPFAFVGLISYGWYLWHWPMISLARMAQFGDVSLSRDLLMAALSFILAVGTYRLVEQPARRFREQADLSVFGQKLITIGFMASLALAIFSGGVGGIAYVWTMRNPAISAASDHLVTASACPEALCESAKGQRGVLVGDSHSDRIERTLRREAGRVGASIGRPQGRGTDARVSAVDFSVVNYRWNTAPWKYETVEERLAEILADSSRRVLLIGPVPEFHYQAANCILRAERYGIDWDRCAVTRASVEERRLPATRELRRLAEKYSNVR